MQTARFGKNKGRRYLACDDHGGFVEFIKFVEFIEFIELVEFIEFVVDSGEEEGRYVEVAVRCEIVSESDMGNTEAKNFRAAKAT